MHLITKVMAVMIKHLGVFEFVQIFFMLATLSIAFFRPNLGRVVFSRVEDGLRAISAAPRLGVLFVVAAALISRGVMLPLIGVSDPVIPDELSIVLQARTYLTGHLSNAALPSDFASDYVLLHPTYASMYPVLRSAPLVAGGLLGIGFLGGVWLSVIALCVLTYWTLCAFVERRYALIAALLVVARFGVFSWWVNSYYGPALTAMGGLLLVGGYARLVKSPRVIDGCALGLGVFLMMTTRPFEGLVFSAPFAMGLLVHFVRVGSSKRPALAMAGVFAVVFVGGGLALTAVHDRAVTGDARRAPYSLYHDQISTAEPFLFEHATSHPPSPYTEQRSLVSFERIAYDRGRTVRGFLGTQATRFVGYFNAYVGFALLVPFAVGAWLLRRRSIILAAAVLFSGCLTVETWRWSQYASPAFTLFILAITMGLRHLRTWRYRDLPVGLALSRWLPLGLLAGFVIPVSAMVVGYPNFNIVSPTTASCCWLHPHNLHTEIERDLDRYPGENIVVVDQRPSWEGFGVVVYNQADVGSARTIWINEDPRLNAATYRRFPNRRRWYLEWRPDGTACLRLMDAPAVTSSNTGPSSPNVKCVRRFYKTPSGSDANSNGAALSL